MQADFGKFFMLIGVIFLITGLVLSSKLQIPWLGKLPGDLHIKRDHFHLYLPVATAILLSILLTLMIRFFKTK
jgi:thiosulfate reductase cytochrome b subunit